MNYGKRNSEKNRLEKERFVKKRFWKGCFCKGCPFIFKEKECFQNKGSQEKA